MGDEECIRDTENPNISGCRWNSRLSNVDLPEPDGPDTTMGRDTE